MPIILAQASPPPPAAIAPADPDLIMRPEWAKTPPANWMSNFYPQALAEDGRGGRAAILCRVGPKGELQDCNVLAETPAGFGMGKALLDIAPQYRLKATDADGRPTAGRPVRFAMNFEPPVVFVHADRGWSVLQDPYGWKSAYPKAALAAGVGGEAVVECRGKSGARQATCEVVSETPAGQGFGDAALALRARILSKPPSAGVDPNDRSVRFTVTFRPPPTKRAG